MRERIAALRRALGLTQQQFASGIGMRDESNSFRLRLISVIAGLSEDQLAVLAEVAERIVERERS